MSSVWSGLLGLALLWAVAAIVYALADIRKGIRRKEENGKRNWLLAPFACLFYGWLGYCLFEINRLRSQDIEAVGYWSGAPLWHVLLAAGVFALFVLAGAYFVVTQHYPKRRERPYASMLLLSVVSGFGNASMIFVVNAAISQSGTVGTSLFPFFVMGMLLFVYGQKLLRTRLIRMTNGIVYDKRMDVLDAVLNATYGHFEAMERGKIEACLNNDTERVSAFANRLVSIGTWTVTIGAGFVYLALINVPGFALSLIVVAAASAAFYGIVRSANRLWEETRDIQNVFFRFIQDLVHGFKELYLHRNKALDFRDEMSGSCAAYRDKRIAAEDKIANVVVIGDLLFASVIGLVVFAFASLFASMDDAQLRSFVFVFLYMAGPLTSILNALPELFQARISWDRMKRFAEELPALSGRLETRNDPISSGESGLMLRLEEASYAYRLGEEASFAIGPIDYEFRSGELIFIVGGNGSGKSTLAKLLTGLYEPGSGSVKLNGEPIAAGDIGNYVSTIFSDAYLFDRLYGIDYAEKEQEAQRCLELLGLKDKVTIQSGRFSTTRLSAGQRKRLALLVSYLDDKPICLFDEWAADQDPEYRAYFYMNLLPDLRSRGKCVIAITHDDRYFGLADKVIKLEMGQIA